MVLTLFMPADLTDSAVWGTCRQILPWAGCCCMVCMYSLQHSMTPQHSCTYTSDTAGEVDVGPSAVWIPTIRCIHLVNSTATCGADMILCYHAVLTHAYVYSQLRCLHATAIALALLSLCWACLCLNTCLHAVLQACSHQRPSTGALLLQHGLRC